ncbi:hypothetical protein P3602_24380 [Vibrio parahaemolyticus]|uniref:hypothetical protein n=1 Tax=Vibrio TaxID=662 RepID=UPI001B83B2DA|nr:MULTISPECIES: hypothetical protein [Vibrio]MCA2422222.1 hypothetical protein [Vibrio alginolyticus]MCA2446861.1 hypothetical protein [Vibrio alginolyticus]MCR9821610.1 hypothetical protein [Vibrio parahaemolyticus]MDF5109053.1 hypothetical protein [Vibrio parahaemolyticus]MDF5143958.1 hypothetical protein [Vibrio parahaemolyticus]
MKISFNPTAVKTTFEHRRSETEITVERINNGALVTLNGSDSGAASFEINSLEELDQLKAMLPTLKNYREKLNRGFCYEYSVLSIDRDTYGDPFEECIQFTISAANPDTPWSERSLSACLSFDDRQRFLDTIELSL